MQAGALGIGIGIQASAGTPARLGQVAFAFENLEVATYRLLARLARRAGDAETAEVAERILEQEEAAAELLAGTFDRLVEMTLGGPAESPLPALTPLGKPSDRPEETGHQGPQENNRSEDAEPAHIDTPEPGEHLASPAPGHPAGTTKPHGEEIPPATSPGPVGSTTPDQDRA